MCMRRRTGEGLIKLVSAFTWSTDDMRMGADRGGADSCAFGRGGAGSMTFDLQTEWGFSWPLER